MLIRSLAAIVIPGSCFIFVTAQTADVKKADANKATGGPSAERLRDMPFPNGVNLQFLIKELARDMDVNVLFDDRSRLELRNIRIELKNVTTAEALDYVLLQEGLYAEEVGPKTILVASRLIAASIPQLGVGTTMLTHQLAQYFGVQSGVLINNVRADSPAAKAGLKAGDVIVLVDEIPVNGPVGLMRALEEGKEREIALRIVRDRKARTVSLRFSHDSL